MGAGLPPRCDMTDSLWVSPDAARAHLQRLRDQGIGLRQGAHLSGLSFSTLQRIRRGQYAVIRREMADTILAIKPIPALGAKVSSSRIRQLIDSLVGEQYTKGYLAWALGYRRRRLRLKHDRITVRNALKVRALWRRLMEPDSGQAQPSA